MSDHIIRALAYEGQVRVSAVVCTDAVETARQKHDAFPTAIAALGRTMGDFPLSFLPPKDGVTCCWGSALPNSILLWMPLHIGVTLHIYNRYRNIRKPYTTLKSQTLKTIIQCN